MPAVFDRRPRTAQHKVQDLRCASMHAVPASAVVLLVWCAEIMPDSLCTQPLTFVCRVRFLHPHLHAHPIFALFAPG
jgi:hypothetical protein